MVETFFDESYRLRRKFRLCLGLTIDRIYSLLEQCTDEQFLICLLSLLRNLFYENAANILPIFNATKLTTVRQTIEIQCSMIVFLDFTRIT